MAGQEGSALAAELRRKISEREAHIGIVGLGYVGLPLAVEFGRAGFRVTGIDVSKPTVDGKLLTQLSQKVEIFDATGRTTDIV